MRYREPAICLRATDYSETSQVVHFFTRGYGTARLLAKGTKRPKSKSGGAIDMLAEGDLVFSASARESLGILMEFTETSIHSPLRKDASRLYAGLYMLELVADLLPEGDPHPEVFDLLRSALLRLEQPDALPQAVLAYFQWRLLRLTGLLGDLGKCVSCGASIEPEDAQRRITYFSSTQGGLLCPVCEGVAGEKYLLDADAVEGLATLSSLQPGRRASIQPKAALAVNRLLHYHLTQQLGKPLRLARRAIG